MSHQRQQMVHPFTFFITNDVSLAYTQAYNSDLTSSLKALYWLACSLDSKGQEKLKNEIEQCEKLIDGKGTGLTTQVYRQLYKTILKELHEEGYFLAAKMTPPTKTTTMKDLAMDLEKAQYAPH